MLVLPRLRAVAWPDAVIDAMEEFDEPQITVAVRSWVEPSEYVPVAVKGCSSPRGMVGVSGVMAIDESTAFVTVRFVVPEIDADVAVIVAVPTARPLAKPAVVMLAVVFAIALQVTDAVRSCVELSVKVPVAVNCSVTPMGTDGLGGVTAIATRAAEVTVRVAVPKIDPEVAVMVEVPVPLVVARPLEVMAATDAWDEVHVAVLL